MLVSFTLIACIIRRPMRMIQKITLYGRRLRQPTIVETSIIAYYGKTSLCSLSIVVN